VKITSWFPRQAHYCQNSISYVWKWEGLTPCSVTYSALTFTYFKKVKVQYKAQAFGLELISVPKQPAGVLSHKLSDMFPLLSQTTLTFRAAELHTLWPVLNYTGLYRGTYVCEQLSRSLFSSLLFSSLLFSSLLFSTGQTAIKLSGAEAADRAQCAAPDKPIGYWNLLVVFANSRE